MWATSFASGTTAGHQIVPEGSVFQRADERWVATYKDAKGTWRYIYLHLPQEQGRSQRFWLHVRLERRLLYTLGASHGPSIGARLVDPRRLFCRCKRLRGFSDCFSRRIGERASCKPYEGTGQNRAYTRCAQPFSVPSSSHDTPDPQKESRHERLFFEPTALSPSPYRTRRNLIMKDELHVSVGP